MVDHRKSGARSSSRPSRLSLKVEEAQFRTAMQRLLEQGSAIEVSCEWTAAEGASSARRKPPSPLRRLPVRQPGGVILLLRVEQVDWIEATDQYVRLHAGDKRYLVRESMTRLESQLDPEQFRRIHRSTIVNLERVLELHVASPTDRWAVLANGSRLRVSQVHWAELQEALVGSR